MTESIIFTAFAAAIYFIPTFVAYKRRHRNFLPIFVVNLVLGWAYGIGWLAALIWSLTANVYHDGDERVVSRNLTGYTPKR